MLAVSSEQYVAGALLLLVDNIPGGEQGFKSIKWLTKSDSKILEYAQKSFKGNNPLSKEASRLLNRFALGNSNPGSGNKLLFKDVYELKGRKEGARVYYRVVNGSLELLGYSNKDLQSKVIGRIKKVHYGG